MTIIRPDSNIISVMTVDDHPLVREALRSLIGKQPDMCLLAEVDTGEKAVSLAVELKPDIVIMDLSLPQINGIEATRQIKVREPRINVLVLTVHNDRERLLRILDAGAAGYLTKSVFGAEITTAIRAIMAGENVILSSVMCKILTGSRPDKLLNPPKKVDLNVREERILNMLAKGLSNKEISEKLDLSIPTVKGYMVNLFAKLEASSRTEALVRALKLRMITIEDLE